MLYKRCKCDVREKCRHAWEYEFELRGVRYRGSTKTNKLQLADRIATNRKSAALEQREGIAQLPVVRLSSHVVDYLKHTKVANVTSYKDKGVLERFEEEVGDRPLTEITPFHIERWKTARAKEVSRSTVNRELNIVRGCFSRAVEWKRLQKSPCTEVDNYRVDDHRIRVLDAGELKTVLSIDDPFVTLMCRVTLESLARLSEVLSIHRTHIGPSWIEMRKKGGRVSRIPVTPELRTALLSRCHSASGCVFGEGETGTIPTQQTASNRILRALQGAGIDDASHHTMRHTGVTIMLEKGVNPRTIQKLAGWSSMRMLERYGHSRDAEAVRAVRSVSSYLEDIERVPAEVPTAATADPRN